MNIQTSEKANRASNIYKRHKGQNDGIIKLCSYAINKLCHQKLHEGKNTIKSWLLLNKMKIYLFKYFLKHTRKKDFPHPSQKKYLLMSRIVKKKYLNFKSCYEKVICNQEVDFKHF